MISEKKLGNCAIVGVKPRAGQNDLTGLFYLLWFEPLSKHLDAVGTYAKPLIFENVKPSFPEREHKVTHKDKPRSTNTAR